MKLLIIALGWILFYFTHSFFADLKVKAYMKSKMGSGYRYYRLAYNLFSLVALGILFAAMGLFPAHSLVHITWLWIPGALLALAGIWVFVLAMRGYDMGEFVGLNALNEADNLPDLSISGINGYVRHPLYFGTFLLLLGLLLLRPTDTMALTFGIAVLYLLIGAKLEEKKLIELYGTSYLEYKQKVKMLIPYIF